jgi:UDP-galactopyranose mutase
MAGPVAIDSATLPHRPNLHWLGTQPYGRLPHLLAGWDVALLPFARNDATAFINPIQTLEYLAGEKPVVSTPVPDVALLHGHVVRLASGVMDVVAACEDTLAETPRQRSRRVMEMLATVSASSWDRTAATVRELIEQVRAEQEPGAAEPALPALASLHGSRSAPGVRPGRPAR